MQPTNYKREKTEHANIGQKRVGIPHNVDFRAKYITRDEEVHSLKMQGSIHQKDVTILSFHH